MSQAGQQPDTERTMVATAATLAAGTAFEPREHFLVVLQGHHAGLRLKLESRPLKMGRSSLCDLVLPDSQVSGQHCEVSLAAMPAVQVRDLGSTNGTFVDGERVRDVGALPPGGLLKLGGQLIRHDYLTRSEAAKAEEHERDLDKARRYVESLLPAPITQGPVRTDWCYVPSASLGGDAFGYHQLSETSFAGYLIDVSGHGVGAAMHSVSVMNVLRQRALPGCDFHDPAQVLRSLNEMFQMDAHSGMYFSMWYGVYDVASRTLRYASAGHHASYLVSQDRSTMVPLATRNLVIGAMPGHGFTSAQATVAAGSTLYVFSDGVFEVLTPKDVQLGLPDFLPLLQQPVAEGAEAKRIQDTVRGWARPGPLDDDLTLLVVTFL